MMITISQVLPGIFRFAFLVLLCFSDYMMFFIDIHISRHLWTHGE